MICEGLLVNKINKNKIHITGEYFKVLRQVLNFSKGDKFCAQAVTFIVFICPFEKRDVLYYGVWRPSVGPSVHP